MDFETFLAQLNQRQIPQEPTARLRLFARELVEGALHEFWSVQLEMIGNGFADQIVRNYIAHRWDDHAPNVALLVSSGYMTEHERELRVPGTPHDLLSARIKYYKLNKEAFDLLKDAPTASVFISYRRKPSSALALLILARLKEHGVGAFVDMTIQPGDDWHQHLQKQIADRDYFVLLLAEETLQSPVVVEEIAWALEAKNTIIPIWQPGFVYQSGKYAVPPAIDTLLSKTHTIRILEESAAAYNTAMVELLNRFGVTP